MLQDRAEQAVLINKPIVGDDLVLDAIALELQKTFSKFT